MQSDKSNYHYYPVWDKPVRIFHWINVLCVLLLSFLGLVMLYKSELGIQSLEAKVKLKEVHVLIGYIFIANLIWRIIWGFIASKHNHWLQLVSPSPKGAFKIKNFIVDRKSGKGQVFLGHNPLGRLAIIFLYFLLLVMSITGLVRAGTDIYYPPFGGIVKSYIVKPGIDASELQVNDTQKIDEGKNQKLRSFKRPFGKIHVYTFYLLSLMIFLHVFAVVLSEIRGESGLISAMISGKKLFKKPPIDRL